MRPLHDYIDFAESYSPVSNVITFYKILMAQKKKNFARFAPKITLLTETHSTKMRKCKTTAVYFYMLMTKLHQNNSFTTFSFIFKKSYIFKI